MSTPNVPAPGRFGLAELLLLVTVGVVWGAAYVFIREGILLGAAPLLFASARYLITAVGFAIIAAARREPFPSRAALLVSAAVGGILFIGLYGGLLYWGEQFTTGGYASVLASGFPVITVAAGLVLLPSESLGPRGLLGIGIGFFGAAVLVFPQLLGSSLGSWQGPLFILAAMTSSGVGTVLLRRFGRGRQGLWQIGTQFAIGGIFLGVVGWVLPIPRGFPWGPGLYEALTILVVLSSIVGYFAYFALHHRVGPVRANLVAYLVPLVGVGIGTGVYGEPVTWWELGGVAIVLVGVSLVLWESSRKALEPAPAKPAP
jgi:drug/metabolite transporter (DMT)-like permease